jgi:hypothetical protein
MENITRTILNLNRKSPLKSFMVTINRVRSDDDSILNVTQFSFHTALSSVS